MMASSGQRPDGSTFDREDPDRGPDAMRPLEDVIKQFQRPRRLGLEGEHRIRGVQHQIDQWSHLLAVQLHRIVPGAGERLPVDLARVVAREVGPVVLKLERTADPGPGKIPGLAAPTLVPKRQAQHFRPGPAGGVMSAEGLG